MVCCGLRCLMALGLIMVGMFAFFYFTDPNYGENLQQLRGYLNQSVISGNGTSLLGNGTANSAADPKVSTTGPPS